MLKDNTNKGFTLVEILVVISIMALLVSIFVPVMASARQQAKMVMCSSNLGQFGLAFMMYLEDHDRKVFPLAEYAFDDAGQLGVLWYFGFEPGSSFSLPEGKRQLFRERARLYPYIEQYDSVEICPAFPYGDGRYKPKYSSKWMTYGANSKLFVDLVNSSHKKVVDFDSYNGGVSNVVIFTDSAQVNTFQSPASPTSPMIEEWHYVEKTGGQYVHFRHREKANILYGDGHVNKAGAEKNSYDVRMPDMKIGRFSKEIPF
ncbi:MAG: prepilin-type N-terminal cleavage/methylation domain-containing protein [Sedimentisphaerales bacterium]|nr:prepilin-type N-terminal cleavage/methylation domain-containing protein [Sedimentisphaerales bacterium]